ncbi:hypothetical protein B9N43_03215 [Denitratisoma sp. DHT3]|uniref:sensor domain-containing diguanylate cyclase n=1 Tax=Denitratisoma sp. DHT3 TaxID=1981880 RepID=UPI0011983A37|nr:sensor domain-containing diguanylate cyclase [Denitratisoma sp. DHT3]QDX80358.1 hypothetical protein B9N43_03215 [Denitratisoma sp. DHT3]
MIPYLLFIAGLLALLALIVGYFGRLNQRLRQVLKQRDEALQRSQDSEERLRLALECAGDGVWDWNIVEDSAHYSDGWWAIIGYPPDSTRKDDSTFASLVHPEDMPRVQEAQQRHWRGETPIYRCEFRMRSRDGSWRWVLSRGMLWARTPQGDPLRMLGTHLDITERKLAESALAKANSWLHIQLQKIQELQTQLANQAIRDSLTGVFNRRYLDETLEREVARTRRDGHPLSVVMVDLDHFKTLNDSYGHLAGDQIIKTVADLLRADTRAEDVVCRYGGEEFLVVLPGMTLDHAQARAETWRERFADAELSFGDFTLRITGSFGVSSYPQHGKTPDDLTHAADSALYQAKHLGRNRVEIYSGESIAFVAKTSSC